MSQVRNTLTSNPHVKCEISMLSTENETSNYRGFLNLGAIVLVVTNFRLIIENMIKYGILLQLPSLEYFTDPRSWPCLTAYLLFAIPALLTFYAEKVLRPKVKSGLAMFAVHFIINAVVLVAPLWLIWYVKAHFLPALTLLEMAAVVSMKQISFAHVCSEVFNRTQSKGKSDLPELSKELKAVVSKYPGSLKLGHFLYFLAAPTLCFQFHYPRTERIRKTWLLKRIGELLIGISLFLIMVMQYMTPLIQNTVTLIDSNDLTWLKLMERHLKLAVPNLFNWLLMFYCTFHCWLNILAELLRFGDRSFYLEWWNSRTLGEYWRLWNLPVHYFLLRHVYTPLLNIGLSKAVSTFGVFFVSAVVHEYLISGSFSIISYWAFLSMIGQVPLVIAMDSMKSQLEKSQLGNVFFWVMFCIVGQPLAVIIYSYHAFSAA
jgi:diacylglycerol O-acyltransferase-1